MVPFLQHIAVHHRAEGQSSPGLETLGNQRPRQAADLLRRQTAQLFQILRPCRLRKGQAVFFRLLQRPAALQTQSALDNGPGEQSPAQLRGNQGQHAHCSGGLTEHRHVVLVPAEGGNVFLNPFQGGNLVQNAVVSRHAAFLPEPGMGQEAPYPQPVVDGHQDHPPVGHGLSVKLLFKAAAGEEGSPVNPHRHRQLFFRSVLRNPQVQIQTVFGQRHGAGGRVAEFPVIEASRLPGGLGTPGPEPVRRQHPFPGLGRLRRFPAQSANRRFCIGDTLEYPVSVLPDTLKAAVFCLHQHIVFLPYRPERRFLLLYRLSDHLARTILPFFCRGAQKPRLRRRPSRGFIKGY